jgi:16S rRNA (cytosine967-C5)-methyltransferase
VSRRILLCLHEIFIDGRPADKVLEFHLKADKRFGSRDRRALAENVYGVVRWWRRLVEASGTPWVDGLGGDPTRVIVETSLAQWLSNWLSLRQTVCDVLPPPQTDFDQRWLSFQGQRATVESIPDWLDQKGFSELGPSWDGILTKLNQEAPVFLRANELLASPQDVCAALKAEDYAVEVVEAAVLQLNRRANIFQSASFKKGLFEMQDRHSQRVAPFLAVEPGQRVIDACAGAGGKTLHLAALMKNKGQILALDIHLKKLEELRRRARRAQVHIVETREISSNKVIKRLEGSADRLLLDVPCSGSGVLRRTPDKKWKLKPHDCDQLLQTQAGILDNYTRMLKVKGLAVYASCSLFPSENQQQVAQFLERNKAYELVEELHLPPDSGDGFYAAKLRRVC